MRTSARLQKRGVVTPLGTWLVSWMLAGVAQAHPQAAQTPVFPAAAECVTVVDKRTTVSVALPYTLPFDDTEIGFADIPVPDAKTHQFFAFNAAVHPAELLYEAFAFEGARAPAIIPEWISVDDVRRAAQSAALAEGVVFSEADVSSDSVLENDAHLSGLWRPITTSAARVPITMAQAQKGVTWDITAVPAGLYTIAGYVFSPPYNGWSVRPGLIKIIDGTSDVPATVADPISEFVFQYQGRRIGLCSDVPAATRLRVSYRVQSQSSDAWLPLLEDVPLASGRSELCFHAPRPDLSGAVRLRFDLIPPGGATTTFYSRDVLTALIGEGRCNAGSAICCDFPGGAPQVSTAAGGNAPPAAGGASAIREPGSLASSPPEASGCSTLAPRSTAPWRLPGAFGLALITSCVFRRVRAARRS